MSEISQWPVMFGMPRDEFDTSGIPKKEWDGFSPATKLFWLHVEVCEHFRDEVDCLTCERLFVASMDSIVDEMEVN